MVRGRFTFTSFYKDYELGKEAISVNRLDILDQRRRGKAGPLLFGLNRGLYLCTMI